MKKQEGQSKVSWKIFVCVTMLLIVITSVCMGAEDPDKFPTRAIKMIVQWSAGGTTDLTGRKLADLASKILGQPIVAINKTGGAGVIAAAFVATSDPDGYTIGTVTPGAMTFQPHLRSVPYNSKEDFTYIMQYCEGPLPFAVRVESPWKTFKEFITEARKNPEKLTYATSGPLSVQHIDMEQITFMEKVKLTHIPVGGGSEVVPKLLGGHLDAGYTNELLPHMESGKLRGLALMGEKRFEQFPDLPTFLDLGYKVEPMIWYGLYAPKGLDPRVLKKLSDAFTKAYEDPSFKEMCRPIYMVPLYRGPESFKAKVF